MNEGGSNLAKLIWRNIISWNWLLFAIKVYCVPVSPPISISHDNKAITFKQKSQASLLYFLILLASIKVTLFNQIQQHQVAKESSLQKKQTKNRKNSSWPVTMTFVMEQTHLPTGTLLSPTPNSPRLHNMQRALLLGNVLGLQLLILAPNSL